MITNQDINQEDIDDYLHYMDRKLMWGDQRKKGDDDLANGAYIKPIHTFSSYNYLIKRNLFMLNEGNIY